MNITQSIKNLIQGVSQQPPTLVHPEQLAEQINGFSTEAGGLQKRPPTKHIKNTGITVDNTALLHVINRDPSEQYISLFTPDGVRIWDKNGVEQRVRYATDKAKSYLKAENPMRNLKVMTVADYTFVLNRRRTTAMSNAKGNTDWNTQPVIVYVKSGQYGRTYSIFVSGSGYAEYTTPDGSKPEDVRKIDISVIVDELATRLRNLGGLTIDTGASWISIKSSNGSIPYVTVKDGFNGNSMVTFHNVVQRFTDLPRTCPYGHTVLVKGESSTADDYYVKYSYNKVWEETVKPGHQRTFVPELMPHAIVHEKNGDFVVKPLEWTYRMSGDEDSNPAPSFVGGFINDIFFFRNRFGIISGENVCLSQSGDYFNFWVDTATELKDTDPIDIAVSHNQVSTLNYAVPFNEDLYLFSENTQFVLRADGVLSPKNVRLVQSTEFSSDYFTRPIGAGKNLYFSSSRSNFTTVREYFAVQDLSDAKDATDITAHVPNYIPNYAYRIISANNENILMVLTSGDRSSLYVYKYLFMDGRKSQASWSKWTFNGDIIGADFINSELYLAIRRDGLLCLESLSLSYNTKDLKDEPYRLHIDRKMSLKNDPTTRTISVKGLYGDKGNDKRNYCVALTDGRIFYTDDEFTKPKDYSDTVLFIGEQYNFEIEFNTFFAKKLDERGTATMPDYRLMLRNVWVDYANTGYLKVDVYMQGKPKYEYTMTGRVLGTDNNVLDSHPISTGQFRVPVQGRNINTRIKVTNDTPLPSAIVGAGWEANVTSRFKIV